MTMVRTYPNGAHDASLRIYALLRFLLLPLVVAASDDLGFEDAVVHEVEVQIEMQKANVSDIIPLPANVTEMFGDIGVDPQIFEFAQAFPPIPRSRPSPDFGQVLADISPPANGSNTNERRQSGLRVLVVGDSMTHCNEGDFTWRYRLWQWFREEGIAMNYVGPYRGTQAPQAPGPPPTVPIRDSPVPQPPLNVDGGYAPEAQAAGFEGWHFAISGRSAAVDQGLIEDVVRRYPPDLMLIMLGFNDLGWFFSDEFGLLRNMKTLIDNARRARPNMRIVVGTVPHRTYISSRPDLVTMTDAYNRMLKREISSWGTTTSPITWAPIREEFECGPQYGDNCPAAFDGLHPNERGEFQIARAFSRALVSAFGLGSQALVVPTDPVRPLSIPTGLQIGSSVLGVTATWGKVYGAHGYDVEYVINGGAPFNFSPGYVNMNRWDSRWSGDGWKYEIRVRSSAGNRKGPWSGWISATARPQLAQAPTLVETMAYTDGGFQLSWQSASGPNSETVNKYHVYFWDRTTPCAFLLVTAFAGDVKVVNFNAKDGIIPGHKYFVAIASVNANGEGFPFVARSVLAGVTQGSGPPQNVQLQAYNGGGGLHATWTSTSLAAYHRVTMQLTNTTEATGVIGNIDGDCVDHEFNFPGTWRHEYTIQAWNGNIPGGRVVRQGPQASDGQVARCPEPPQWCPAGTGGPPPVTDAIDPRDPSSDSGGGGNTEIYWWDALGDSFAAGPGAGNPYDSDKRCARGDSSYPPLLNERLSDPPSNIRDARYRFLACTGDVTQDVLNNQIGAMNTDAQHVTLSIGGNDIGFVEILFACIFRPFGAFAGNCDQKIAEAERILNNELEARLAKVYDAIFTRSNPPRGVAIQLYPAFFNDSTTWCNTESMGIWRGQQPLLTQALRRKMNSLSALVRQRMITYIDRYQTTRLNLPAGDPRRWNQPRITIMDRRDELYNTHRFCEDRDKGTFNNGAIWFFRLGTNTDTGTDLVETAGDLRRRFDADNCVNDPQYGRLNEFTWACELARYNAHPEGQNNNLEARLPRIVSLARVFHPKASAFNAIAREHRSLFVPPAGARLQGEEEET